MVDRCDHALFVALGLHLEIVLEGRGAGKASDMRTRVRRNLSVCEASDL